MKKIVFIIIILLNINVLASTSTIVMDTNSHRILYQNNAYERKLIASTTKIMTFVVAYEYAKDFLDLEIEAGNEILKMYGTSIYISLHEKMKLSDLLYGLMLRSGNDAAVVIANFVGGNEEGFVKLMNKKARFIGMNNTTFSNPHGLDESTKNYSTAYDMALLSSYASSIPFYREVTKTKYYNVQTDIKSYSWINRNKMVFTYPYFETGKTGYTPSAGKTFVTTAKKNNLELTIVSLNDNNHYETHRNLYEKMFDKYENTLLVSSEEFNNKYSNMILKNDLYYPLTNDEKKDIEITLVINNNVDNKLVINLKNKEIISEPIYVKDKNKTKYVKESFFEKIKNFFQKIL